MLVKRVVLASLAISAGVLWSAPAQAELGPRPPRWSEADVVSLNADFVTLLRGERELRRRHSSIATALEIARQQQLMGADDEDRTRDHQKLRDLWKQLVVDPAMRIAENPATPCKLAQLVMTKLFEGARQEQLLGLDTNFEEELARPDSLMSRALRAAKRRCLEQAYDACMASGNGQHIVTMLAEAARQAQLLPILEDSEFEAQSVYLLRRCTVYQLRYHSQTRAETRTFKFRAVYDGSVILLSDVDPGSGFAGLAQPHEWVGPRSRDPDDVIASVEECASPVRNTRMVCGPPQPMTPARARIRAGGLSMKRYFDEIEIYEWDETREPRPLRPPVTRTPKSDGTDALTLTYEPGMVVTMSTVSGPGMTLPLPMPPSKTSFLTAHTGARPTASDVTLAQWTRVGVDVLFEQSVQKQATVDKVLYGDTSRFELVHRPDLYPPEEVVPKWELDAPP